MTSALAILSEKLVEFSTNRCRNFWWLFVDKKQPFVILFLQIFLVGIFCLYHLFMTSALAILSEKLVKKRVSQIGRKSLAENFVAAIY